MPPLPLKLLDKIRKWDYVDLTLLLDDHSSKPPEDYPIMGNNQIVVIDPDRAQRRRKQISDIFTWMKAFSRYVAALTSCESTTSAQATGLVAHLHLILQLSQELGPQWQKYDIDYRQWAAARNIRQWGDLNFSIYGHCLSSQQRFPTSPKPSSSSIGSKRAANQDGCYRWNSKGRCDRVNCPFAHRCLLCGGHHQAIHCPLALKRNKA